ncbi:hypothetical protein PanWU01x14_157310 [Parasponia andersonii]|uniref:Major facilitator, sugar transporter-like n=1 Tax=Parasponia andersonii TaxID=3476 RepID=A0A2P5CFM4_PARAD|nr:hypothetical protein PanWU01x14_157310 [Parasponia andersonii]
MLVALTYYWRLRLLETPRYTALVAKDQQKTCQDMSKFLKVEIQNDNNSNAIEERNEISFGVFSSQFLNNMRGIFSELSQPGSSWMWLSIASSGACRPWLLVHCCPNRLDRPVQDSGSRILLHNYFLARFRSVCHGKSVTASKAGVIVGAFRFLYAAQSQDKIKTDAGYLARIEMKNSLIVLGVIIY